MSTETNWKELSFMSTLTANIMKNKESKYDETHGGPYDRGAADSWYIRPRCPHYYGRHGLGKARVRISIDEMTKAEIEAYHAGYDDNESVPGCHKDYS